MAKKQARENSTQHQFIKCDLEFPRLQEELRELEEKEFEELNRCIDKIEQMTWQQVYQTSSKTGKRGLNYEPIEGQKTASGVQIASIRVTKKCRARVVREREFMRFISLHPDHDSAYTAKGGEQV